MSMIYGSSIFAKVLRSLLDDCALTFNGYIDDFSTGDDIAGSYQSLWQILQEKHESVFLGVGYKDLLAREKIASRLVADNLSPKPLIHPKAIVHSSAKIGVGCIIMAGAIVDCRVEMGPWGVVWPGTVINHDSFVGANTFLSPNSTICGLVTIGANTFVGAASVILDRRDVPSGSFIKAGSVFA